MGVFKIRPLTVEFLRNLNVKNCEPFELYFLSFFILLLTIGIMTSSQLNKLVECASKQCYQKMWQLKTGMNCRCKRTNEFFCSDRRYTSSLTEFKIYFFCFFQDLHFHFRFLFYDFQSLNFKPKKVRRRKFNFCYLIRFQGEKFLVQKIQNFLAKVSSFRKGYYFGQVRCF